MTLARKLCGFGSIILFAVGLNVLMVQEEFFSRPVMIPIILGLAGGVVWLVLTLVRAARSTDSNQTLYGLNSVVGSAVFLAICMTVYAFASHWDQFWDLTREGRRELSPITTQVVQNLTEDVEVLCFFTDTGDRLANLGRDHAQRFLARIGQHNEDHFHVEFLDPQVDQARLAGVGLDRVSPQGTIVVRSGSRHRAISLSGANPQIEERAFTNALVNVVREREPRVYFLTGHGERDVFDRDPESGFSAVRVLLESEGYTVEQLELDHADPQVPANADVLVINGPRSDLNPRSITALQAYVERGGRIMIMLDPWRRHDAGMLQVENLRPWIEAQFGVRMDDGLLVSQQHQTQLVLSNDSTLFGEEHDAEGRFMGSFNYRHPITQGFAQQMVFVLARPVTPTENRPEGVTRTALLRSTPDFWQELDLDFLFETGQAQRSDDEPQGPLPLAMAATRQTDVPAGDTGETRDARLVAVGATEFASNAMLPHLASHQNFLLNTMAWLTESEELIAIRPSEGRTDPIFLTDGQEQFIAWMATLGVLQLCLVSGLAVYAARRKYQ